VLVIFGQALPRARCSVFGLFKNFWGDVIVSTDMTPEGRALTPPEPGKPVYYLGLSLGARLGSIGGDRMPEVKEMNQMVTRILAKQGYLGAKPGVHDPALYLVVQWGYVDSRNGDLLWFLGYDAAQDIGSPAFPGMLGPEVFRRGFRSHTTQTILENASGPIYGIIVTAFEYKSAKTPTPVVYWQSRIGLPANGKSMSEALPTMLIAAGTAIGRESKSPVLRSADDVLEGRVELGELKFLDVISEPPHDEKSDSR
jgi:hypothetical protein